MAGIWTGEETQERIDLWLTRVLVLVSFVSHLTLALLAGIRGHRDSGVRRSLVWLAYYVTEIATPVALGMVFLDTTTADSKQQLKVSAADSEQQLKLFALWAPFLLLHLGRPDNITSYALENKELSPTQKAAVVLEIVGATYGSYKQRFMRGDGPLRVAFFIMLLLGSYKYVERAVALRRASFDNIRRRWNERKKLRCISIEDKGRKQQDDDDDVLLDAHGLLDVTMGTFVGYQVNYPGGYRRCYSDWEDVSKVVETEASLMYDMLYTKASVIHTWGGYIIRLVSPPATATALYLFHGKKGQGLESADRTVTYILLIGNLVLDVRWLLRALGSTWTYAFSVDTEQDKEEGSKGCLRWLKIAGHRAVRQSWYLISRIPVSLDLSRLSLRSGHRLLPGSGVGQSNLLDECSNPQVKKAKKKIDVEDELFQVLSEYIVLGLNRIFENYAATTEKLTGYIRDNSRTCSFERNLIALHVATDIFLLYRPTSPGIESQASAEYEKQIRTLSDYMMFLLAQRQHMVLPPGDEGSHYKKALHDLKEIWRERGGTSGSQTTVRETKQLASILLNMDETPQGSNRKASLLSDRNDTLALGADWALKLLHQLDPARYGCGRHATSAGIRSQVQSAHRLEDFILVFTDEAQETIKRYTGRQEQSEILDYMLQLILASWVRLLTFTSDQCSRESHAKQLSCGGELLTIVWLMNQHGELDIISKRE